MQSVIVGGVLLVVLLAVAFAFLWQERHTLPEDVVIYGTEDALEFVMPRLSQATLSQLKSADVRRILEWEMLFLQDPVRHKSSENAIVVGGLDAAAFAQTKAHEHGYSYNPEAIIDVLDRQAEYLAALGAIGVPADADEVERIIRSEQAMLDESDHTGDDIGDATANDRVEHHE